jgi:hypothetical protein
MHRIVMAVFGLFLLGAVAEAAPSKAAREGFVEQFAEMQKSGELPFSLKLGTPDTSLSVVVGSSGRCSRPLLAKIVELIGEQIRNVGFTLVECASDRTVNVRP